MLCTLFFLNMFVHVTYLFIFFGRICVWHVIKEFSSLVWTGDLRQFGLGWYNECFRSFKGDVLISLFKSIEVEDFNKVEVLAYRGVDNFFQFVLWNHVDCGKSFVQCMFSCCRFFFFLVGVFVFVFGEDVFGIRFLYLLWLYWFLYLWFICF